MTFLTQQAFIFWRHEARRASEEEEACRKESKERKGKGGKGKGRKEWEKKKEKRKKREKSERSYPKQLRTTLKQNKTKQNKGDTLEYLLRR